MSETVAENAASYVASSILYYNGNFLPTNDSYLLTFYINFKKSDCGEKRSTAVGRAMLSPLQTGNKERWMPLTSWGSAVAALAAAVVVIPRVCAVTFFELEARVFIR